jgi:hypothetical protein
MPTRLHKLTACGLIALYGAIALLGHAGLHVVGGHHHGHAQPLDYHVAASHHAEAQHAAAHRHGSRCHHHGHSHAGHAHATHRHAGHEHAPHQHEPLHDEDTCSICQYFSAHGVVLTLDAPLPVACVAEPVLCVSPPRLPGSEQFQLPIRGPPALGC